MRKDLEMSLVMMILENVFAKPMLLVISVISVHLDSIDSHNVLVGFLLNIRFCWTMRYCKK